MDSNAKAMYWQQGGLGLGDRDYLSGRRRTPERARRLPHISETLGRLAGRDDESARRMADNTIKLETELARSQRTRTELQRHRSNYNPMAVADLKKNTRTSTSPVISNKKVLKQP